MPVALDITQNTDGSVVVQLETRRAAPSGRRGKDFNENLADVLDDQALATISYELLEGIDADINSRKDWIESYANGMALLGLKLEDSSKTETQTSTVRHPLLLWSVIKGQSLARGELLPASGPAKVRSDGDLPPDVAEDLQRDINHYLTTTAFEYYPDTDRGLFYLFYGGTIFKKVYKCPVRQRPVSECVYADDLIVSQDAVDLQSAARVTHQIPMGRQKVAQYQRLGLWKDVSLGEPVEQVTTVAQAEGVITGITPQKTRQQDWQYTIYECYTTLDLGRWDHGEKDQDAGHELPYRVTIERDSRQVLEIKRNWKEDDELRLPKKRFSKWGMVPGIGFLDLGFLHLLGNHTRALTALERILIDAGIFSNFPAGVRKMGARLQTNLIRPAPGEFPEIDTGGDPIQSAIMALPFKGPTGEALQLMSVLVAEGEKVAGQIDIVSGDGSPNVPVGTIMAQIEQGSQNTLAVHKRLHAAQGEELQMLRDLLVEQPELLLNSNSKWTKEQFASATLVPASDPNVPAHIHRIMQAWVLEGLSNAHPAIYNQREVQKRVLDIARVTDPEGVLMPLLPPGPPPQDPTAMLAQLQMATEKLKAELRNKESERETAVRVGELELAQQKEDREQAKVAGDLALSDQKTSDARRAHLEKLADKAADRSSREQIALKTEATAQDIAAMEAQATMDLAAMDAINTEAKPAGAPKKEPAE